ncbi:SPOSA6832_00692 [Sporobolomyces salmonicolor]|uniref:DNA damage-inducible protein 1 n=1 Tax=Sporidiobolus salmonicolor TaxID=5005 RepID=A0A0D6EI15_SPOSA|nr:SPOSA6832_00692 [Sporobolomyces salmonicolor]
MLVTVATEEGNTFSLDLDPTMELENVLALLEAESGISVDDQLLFFSGKQLTGLKDSLESYGVNSGDVLLLRQRSTDPGSQSVAGRNVDRDSETMRRQLLGDPRQMARLREVQPFHSSELPEIAAAAESDPARFRELLHQFSSMQESARLQQQREAALLNSDPFNVEAQRKIEEAIRHEAVLENMEQAMEQMPESFGSVHMLYVNAEVNGHPVKAFVDSGAQSTIMSPSCAERCGIMRLLDKRFAGMARGVGTAKILGRLKMGDDLFLQCSFTILEGKNVDLLFGLDMLKRHQASIDLLQDALIIQGRKIPFLPEHEIPKGEFREVEVDAYVPFSGTLLLRPPFPSEPDRSRVAHPDSDGNVRYLDEIPPADALPDPSTSSASSSSTPFPGSGNTLGAAPSSSNPTTAKRVRSNDPEPASTVGGHSEEAISSLVALGVDRGEAVKLLDATGGNAEMAASLLFSG